MSLEARSPWLATGTTTLGVLAVAAVSGTSGSPLSPLLPPGGHALPPFRWAAGALGLTSASSAARAVIALSAFALVGLGFLLAARGSWDGWLSMRLVLWFGIGFQVVALLMPLLVSRDVYHYAMYGRIVAIHHANPYVATPDHFRSDPLFRFVGSEWREVPAFYGPVFLRLTALVARYVRTPAGLIWAFKSISAAATIATVAVTARLARRVWPQRAAFAVVALAWNPVVLFHVIGAGHGDALIALAVVTGIALLVRSRRASSPRTQLALELTATASFALAALMKSPLVIPLVIGAVVCTWARPRGARARRLAAHLSVALTLTVVAAMPYVSSRDPTLGLFQLSSWSNYYSASAVVQILIGTIFTGSLGAGASSAMATAVRIGFILAFGVAFVFLLRRLVIEEVAPRPRELGAAFAWSLLLFLLVAPILWPWYLMWLLPLVWLLQGAALRASVILCAAFPLLLGIAEQRYAPVLYRSLVVVGVGVLGPTLLFVLIRLMRELMSKAHDGRRLFVDVGASSSPASARGSGSRVTAPGRAP